MFRFLGDGAPQPITAAGLRRGFTTGSAAAACVAGAVRLLGGEQQMRVNIPLPEGVRLEVDLCEMRLENGGSAWASVIKDGGDDPDATHGATIWVQVWETGGDMTFEAGEGVGTITRAGLRLAIGEAAINPIPREMMRWAAREAAGHEGFRVRVGCIGGEERARKTFNPRLGIVGGISILGTSGVVEPMSLEAYAASVAVNIRFALANKPTLMAWTPGKLGRDWAEKRGVARGEIIQISNFVGDSLAALQEALDETDEYLPHLLLAGHPSKLAKVLNGDWNTHSAHSRMAMDAVARVAQKVGWAGAEELTNEPTVEACTERLAEGGKAVWVAVATEIAQACLARAGRRVGVLEVALFALDGRELGVGQASRTSNKTSMGATIRV